MAQIKVHPSVRHGSPRNLVVLVIVNKKTIIVKIDSHDPTFFNCKVKADDRKTTKNMSRLIFVIYLSERTVVIITLQVS